MRLPFPPAPLFGALRQDTYPGRLEWGAEQREIEGEEQLNRKDPRLLITERGP